VKDYNFINYMLFVTYFPHLIAGPILHHKEMIPQFGNKNILNFRLQLFVMGLSVFFIGLFKKVIIADTLATYATPVFNTANSGSTAITFFSAWGGAVAYALQLYYDFSGYCDMAIGISLFFGIRLPLNFYSPYKAINIIDFWRRWHMTLSRFLRDYLYIALGGNRKGKARRYINLVVTMLLGGLWHGAAWTFVIWGGLHACYLLINHAWQSLRGATRVNQDSRSWLGCWIARIITFMAVTVAWVFFRAESIAVALNVLRGMTGSNGFILPSPLLTILNRLGSFGTYLEDQGLNFSLDPVFDQWGYLLLLVLLAFTWFAPNTQQFMARYKTTVNAFDGDSLRSSWLQWRLTPSSAVFCALLTFLAVLGLNEVLYFQF
jgi:alginate O-acetyltransferase complex protein AlgI